MRMSGNFQISIPALIIYQVKKCVTEKLLRTRTEMYTKMLYFIHFNVQNVQIQEGEFVNSDGSSTRRCSGWPIHFQTFK